MGANAITERTKRNDEVKTDRQRQQTLANRQYLHNVYLS